MEPSNPQDVKIERFVAAESNGFDTEVEVKENALRPRRFDEFPGQDRAKDNLQVYVHAAMRRNEPLDHVLLHGPPGLGKTSLARVVANELGVSFHQTSGPAIDKPGDLAGLLAGLEQRAVLFIDEIHRLSIYVEEVLYSAMEDYCIDLVVGQGPSARTVKMPIQPFTLIGATTRMASLSSPLVSRFGINERFDFYDLKSLGQILARSAGIEGIVLTDKAAEKLAARSRGTPRVANRLLRRVRDFASVHGESSIDSERIDYALARMDIDSKGLEPLDRRILEVIVERYSGGPVGIDTLAHTLGEDKSTIEEVYEPFLVHQGLVLRGPRGREITAKGREHLTYRR